MNNGILLDLDQSGRKPWPGDAVMIVASRAGTENRAKMTGVAVCHCRDCGTELRADPHTIRVAHDMPERHGRPIKFFCVECAITYERDSLDVLQDLRDRKDCP